MRIIKTPSIFILGLAIVLFGCGTGSEDGADGKEDLYLEGSWVRLEGKNHNVDPPQWEKSEEGLIYQKHLTPTHFTWLSYDPEKDELLGAGGGTYTLVGSAYTENIEFFHPVVSSYLGQAIPFEARVEDGIWYHTGSAKIHEFDPEIAELVVVDTAIIEEKWEKIPGTSDNLDMVRTWHLLGYKDPPDSDIYSEYPEFVGYMKLLTATHFVWIRFNKEEQGGEVLGLGSGGWDVDGKTYREYIKLVHPPGSKVLNTTAVFDMKIDSAGKWHHYGYVKSVEFNEGVMNVLDSGLVDEIWIGEQ